MWPSRSAYTRFCEGTSNSDAASRNAFQFCARLIAKIASAVRPGVSAVQCRATPYASVDLQPVGRQLAGLALVVADVGDDRAVPGLPDGDLLHLVLTGDLERLLALDQRADLAVVETASGPLNFSRYRSITSGSRLVKPQEIALLWPITTPGRPEKLNPDTSNGHVVPTLLQCRPTWVQMPGMVAPRCGSLASSGLPVVVCSPETTHEFEPIPSPRPSSCGSPFATLLDGVERLEQILGQHPAPGLGLGRGGGELAALGQRGGRDDRLVAVVGVGRVEAGRCCVTGYFAASLVRAISSSMLPPRSHAIAFSQASESAAVHGSGR